jgi:hypothetical protein
MREQLRQTFNFRNRAFICQLPILIEDLKRGRHRHFTGKDEPADGTAHRLHMHRARMPQVVRVTAITIIESGFGYTGLRP